MGSNWKLLLTFLQTFAFNVTWLLHPTLKHTDKFRSNSVKSNRNMSNMFKVNNKDTKTMPGAAAVNFEHISHFIITTAVFKQINASSTWETVISDN